MTFTASDVLLKAASRIEEEGMWCQKEFYKLTNAEAGQMILAGAAAIEDDPIHRWAHGLARTGRRVPECAQGALLSAAIELGNPDLYAWARDRLRHFVTSKDCFGLIDFNDAPGRTAAEVAEAMRRAAL